MFMTMGPYHATGSSSRTDGINSTSAGSSRAPMVTVSPSPSLTAFFSATLWPDIAAPPSSVNAMTERAPGTSSVIAACGSRWMS